MTYKSFQITRMIMAAFIAIIVSIAIKTDNAYLMAAAILIGMISLILVKRNVKAIMMDELIEKIAEKASYSAYSITTVTLAILSIIFIFSNLNNESSYLYNLGTVFSYIVLFSMTVYSFAYSFYRKKYGSNK